MGQRTALLGNQHITGLWFRTISARMPIISCCSDRAVAVEFHGCATRRISGRLFYFSYPMPRKESSSEGISKALLMYYRAWRGERPEEAIPQISVFGGSILVAVYRQKSLD